MVYNQLWNGKTVVLLFACISVLVLAITLNEDLSKLACIDKFEYTPICVRLSVELPSYFQSSWLLKNTEAQKVQPSCRGKGLVKLCVMVCCCLFICTHQDAAFFSWWWHSLCHNSIALLVRLLDIHQKLQNTTSKILLFSAWNCMTMPSL